MSKPENQGYGISRGELEAFQEEPRHGGGRGPDCPFLLELLALVMGQIPDEKTKQSLENHLEGCESCRSRYESQQRARSALERLTQEEGATPVGEEAGDFWRSRRSSRRARVRKGRLVPVGGLAAAPCTPPREYEVELATVSPSGDPLTAQVEWIPDAAGQAVLSEGGSWRLELRIPHDLQQGLSEQGQADFRDLRDQWVRLSLYSDALFEPVTRLEVLLDWDESNQELVTARPELCPNILDPKSVTSMEMDLAPERSLRR